MKKPRIKSFQIHSLRSFVVVIIVGVVVVTLALSGVFFFLKAVLFLVAPNVTMIYVVQIMQTVTYCFLAPTQLFYANNKIDPVDMVKGQAFITASYTLGCAFGNFLGGQLLELFNVTALLMAGGGIAAIGTAILFVTVDKKDAYTKSTQ